MFIHTDLSANYYSNLILACFSSKVTIKRNRSHFPIWYIVSLTLFSLPEDEKKDLFCASYVHSCQPSLICLQAVQCKVFHLYMLSAVFVVCFIVGLSKALYQIHSTLFCLSCIVVFKTHQPCLFEALFFATKMRTCWGSYIQAIHCPYLIFGRTTTMKILAAHQSSSCFFFTRVIF